MADVSSDADRALLARFQPRAPITQRSRASQRSPIADIAGLPDPSAIASRGRDLRGDERGDENLGSPGGLAGIFGRSLRGGRRTDVSSLPHAFLSEAIIGEVPERRGGASDERGGVDTSEIEKSPEVRFQEAQESIAATTKMSEQIAELEGQALTPQSQVAVNTLREELAVELSRLENDLLETQNQLAVQDILFDFQADQAGLGDALDLAPLKEAIQQEGGLGGQTMKAITDIANNAALSAKEQDEAIDLLMQRNHFSKALVGEVSNMVQNQKDLQALEARSDVELLGNAAEFFNPLIPFDTIQPTPELRFVENFDENFFAGDWMPEEIGLDHPSMQLYDNVADQVAVLGEDNPSLQAQISALATAWGLTPGEMRRRLRLADDAAKQSEQAWEDAATATSLTPGSEGMIAAIVLAGEEMGIPPEFLDLLAKNKDLHIIIDQKSGGKAGVTPISDGTIHGVGGLTEAMYEVLMGEEWSKDKGMKWELQALLKYIMEGFDGDPLAAVQFFRQTGEWGGTAALDDE